MIYNDRKQISGCWGREWVLYEGGITKGKKDILRVMDIYIILIMVIDGFISV